ncbi:hypothetical protein E2C01_081898 [Portunus trituberculatus]|uniref:Uncharacterized protein n=1 Tax=Portunus trituberculatus TaxID=210409 RepID=A0A5B7IR00_PORTR|nr:hypothetical protein [Portunus trituberculatus]
MSLSSPSHLIPAAHQFGRTHTVKHTRTSQSPAILILLPLPVPTAPSLQMLTTGPPIRVWEALFSFHPLVTQAISFIVEPILGPISPPKHIFGVRQLHLHLEPGYHGDTR